MSTIYTSIHGHILAIVLVGGVLGYLFYSGKLKVGMFSKHHILMVVAFVAVAFLLYWYSDTKYGTIDGMESGPSPASAASATSPPLPKENDGSAPVSGYVAQPVATPSELLPSDKNSQWAKLNPVSQVGGMPDLLTAGYHIGLDTIGQTMKNANLQLRSDPYIPVNTDISPWNVSTNQPDLMRPRLEIGN